MESDIAIRRKSLALTILIHGLILLALLFFVISTRIPPFEEGTLAGGGGGGTIVDFGELAVALDASSNTPKQSTPVEEQPAPTPDENVMISETEETTPVIVHKNQKIKKIKEKKVALNKKAVKPEVKVEKVEAKVPTVNQHDMYHRASSQGTSQTANEGKQGSPNGKEGGSLYQGSGTSGSGGGTGTGKGIGSGPGIGAGNGPFSGLRWGSGGGRSIISAPQFHSKTNEPGKVTLKIFVDENGNVTRAERDETQTLNPTQVAEALEYVKKVKFSKGSGISIAYPTIEFSAK